MMSVEKAEAMRLTHTFTNFEDVGPLLLLTRVT